MTLIPGVIFINKRLIHSRLRKVIKMSDGHKKYSHEHRKDLAGEYRWSDTGQIVLLIIFIIGMTSDLFLLKVSDSWQDVFPWYLRAIIFIILFFIAGYLAQTGLKQVFHEEREDLQVISSGVFGIVRHPIYLGSIILFLSFVVLSFSLMALSIWFVVIAFYYYLCKFEENLLIDKLGDKYRNYMKKVPMLIPSIKKK
jgi:protein-S-isoprenylcysteine O-methyltransferase Ste14